MTSYKDAGVDIDAGNESVERIKEKVKQTFNPDGTTPGLNIGSQAGDPSTPANGDTWYNSSTNLGVNNAH